MNLRITFLTTLVGCILSGNVFAQYSSDLRLNEVLVLNENGLIDQFGDHTPWIEIFNTAYNSINISGLYLSNDLNNLTLYKIPDDPRLKIPQRSYILFYCDGNSTKGIFHTNFKLDSSGVVYLVDGDGLTILDSVQYSFTEADVSYLREIDGASQWVYMENPTPMQSNAPQKTNQTANIFLEYDPFGIGMTLISMFVVMSALILSYLTFKYISRLYRSDWKKKKPTAIASVVRGEEKVISGEIAAAIAMSLHLYVNEMHDLENTIITIRKISKTYSPWSSKLYMLRSWPQKRNN